MNKKAKIIKLSDEHYVIVEDSELEAVNWKSVYEDSLSMQKCSNAGYESKIAELESEIKRMYNEQDMIEFGDWCENLQKDNKNIRRSSPDITRKELFELWKNLKRNTHDTKRNN